MRRRIAIGAKDMRLLEKKGIRIEGGSMLWVFSDDKSRLVCNTEENREKAAAKGWNTCPAFTFEDLREILPPKIESAVHPGEWLYFSLTTDWRGAVWDVKYRRTGMDCLVAGSTSPTDAMLAMLRKLIDKGRIDEIMPDWLRKEEKP